MNPGRFNLTTMLGSLERLPAHDRLGLLKALLHQFSGLDPSAEEFLKTFAGAQPELRRAISTAARVVEYEKAIEHLEELVEVNSKESKLQAHLAGHPWMFSSEYSELLDRRTWNRG